MYASDFGFQVLINLIWVKEVAASLKVLSWNWPGDTGENHERPSDNQQSGRDSNRDHTIQVWSFIVTPICPSCDLMCNSSHCDRQLSN